MWSRVEKSLDESQKWNIPVAIKQELIFYLPVKESPHVKIQAAEYGVGGRGGTREWKRDWGDDPGIESTSSLTPSSCRWGLSTGTARKSQSSLVNASPVWASFLRLGYNYAGTHCAWDWEVFVLSSFIVVEGCTDDCFKYICNGSLCLLLSSLSTFLLDHSCNWRGEKQSGLTWF